MKIGTALPYAGDIAEGVDQVLDLERAGLDVVFLSEAYGFDAVSQMGYLAARTSNVEIASNILQIYSRTPTLIAMTAAGLDYVSGGRFLLGIGSSGPQVIEGFHGVPYNAPIARTREVVEICRKVWRREPVVHQGRHYHLPLAPEFGGSGLGRPLKLITTPVRERIPIMVAAIGPQNVAMVAELADAWAPIFFNPERADAVWGDALRTGTAKRAPELGQLEIVAPVHVGIGEDVDAMVNRVRPHLALYIGGMGARGKNFYNTLAVRYGYEREAALVQDLYLSGHKDDAAAAVPADLVKAVSILGPPSYVAERVAAFAAAGVTTLNATIQAPDSPSRVRAFDQFRGIVDSVGANG